MPRSPTDKHTIQPRTLLLATDNKNSALIEIATGKPNSIAYCAYGQQSAQQVVATGLGFNGQFCEAQIGWYLLGNGYRAYNPVLMRFHSPDSWSPFGKGGLNAYMYCGGDPVNASDPTGHMPKGLFSKLFNGKKLTGSPNESTTSLISSASTSTSTSTSIPLDHKAFTKLLEKNNGPRSPKLDPDTKNPIFETLRVEGRTWHAPSNQPVPEEMMSYSEMAQNHNSPVIWRSEPSTVRINDTGGHVRINPSSSNLPPPNSPTLQNRIVRGKRGEERVRLGNGTPFSK